MSINGETRTSWGGYVQGQYTWDRLTVGGSWGISALDRNPEIDPVTLQRYIDSEIGYVRYKLTDWVNFQFEYVHTEEQNYASCASAIGCRIRDDAVVGGTTFFW